MDFEPIYSVADSVQSIKDWIDARGLDEDGAASDASYGSGVEGSES